MPAINQWCRFLTVDGASTVASSPGNNLVKNFRVIEQARRVDGVEVDATNKAQ